MTALLALLLAAHAAPGGWRGDGTSTFPAAAPPLSWSADRHVRWSVPLASWGNASPVPVGDGVCVLLEPVTLACHRADDGVVSWVGELHVVDVLEGVERERVSALLARAEADEARLREVRAEYSKLQREVRRSGGEASAARLEELDRERTRLQLALDEVAPYRTPPDKDIIGYGTPTPATDGQRLFVLTGHGVIAAFDSAGRRLWARWLGPQPAPMRGYHTGHTSSPQLVDGVLVVPYGRLRGLDPATGAERWALADTWDHYGTPAVGAVGGLGVAVTPAGQVVRARDGKVLAEGLGDLWYLGPHLVGNTVFVVGNSGDVEKGDKRVIAEAWRLVRAGDGVTVTPLWQREIETRGRFYTAPVLHDGRLWVFDVERDVWVLDPATGATVAQADLRETLPDAEIYPSPSVAGGRLYVSSYRGRTVVLDVTDGVVEVVATSDLDEVRASPWFEGGRVYVRSLERLWCLEQEGAR